MSEEKKYTFKTLGDAEIYEKQLLDNGFKLEEHLDDKLKIIENCNSGILGCKKKLKKELSEYFNFSKEVTDFRREVRQYQKYSSSKSNCANQNAILNLLDIMEQIDKKMNVCFELITRIVNEISSVRLAATNIILSIAAIIVAIIAIS